MKNRRRFSLPSYLLLFAFSLCMSSNTAAAVLADYDAGWTKNLSDERLESSTSVWTTLDGGHAEQKIFLDSNVSVNGRSARTDIVGYGRNGLFKVYFAYERNRRTTLDAPDGTNRMNLHTIIPFASHDSEHTFHIGTYSKNPATASQSNNLGNHWYHYYKLRGSKNGYWTKMYMNKHPQHVVGSKVAPANNPPSGFDYFDGLTRLYLQMAYSPIKENFPGPYSVWVDEINYYQESRPENEYSINSVAVTYHGDDEFDIDWSSFSQYDVHNETFEIRYSLTPIDTEADYLNAAKVPGSPQNGWGEENIGRRKNHYRATFSLLDVDVSKTLYFAIKDLYAGHPKQLKRVNYNISTGGQPVAPPLSPSNKINMAPIMMVLDEEERDASK